ncbi:MAG: hypothetical protein H6Q19_2093 [Bacteroidetes bacterium]|nr:hypothetical protein [Bacteroidota bacterium]
MKSKGTNYTQKQKNVLATLGENIKLARLRRVVICRCYLFYVLKMIYY